MSLYNLVMAPLEKFYLSSIRKEIMSKAYGKVLEIGFGNGANMAYYDFDRVDSIHVLDIKENMPFFEGVTYHKFSAEKLPFVDKSFDTVVLTLALCSIPRPQEAIGEIRRVLKDSGLYIFIEHEKPRGSLTGPLSDFFNPLWRRLAQGCQINLNSHRKIKEAGFTLDHKNQGVFHYGLARKDSSFNLEETKK